MTLTVVSNPADGGTVQVSPYLSSYSVGASVTLTAKPSASYVFQNWTGDISGIANPSQPTVTFVMSANRTITANFSSSARYVVTVAASPAGGGSVTLDPSQPDYSLNQTVSAVASPSEGYVFSHWSGDLSGTGSTASLLVNDNKSITAVFNPTLTIQKTPDNGGTVEATPVLTSDGYPVGTEVSLNVQPSSGYAFEGWTGDVAGISDVKNAAVNVTMDAPRTLTANFVASPPPPMKVSTSTEGGGSITLQPAQPSGGYPSSQEITVYASASEGYVFSHWSGDLSGTDSTASLLVDDNKSITAVFNPVLTIQNTPADTGKVEANPALTTGGYPVGTVVSLNAQPSLGYIFAGWTGDVSGISDVSSAAVAMTMDGPRTLTANFVASPPMKVATSTQYEGSGSVTVEPAQPPEGYPASQEIKVYALPSEGYAFSHWAGDVNGSDPALTLTVDSEKNITAVFDPTVTIEHDPTEGGTVKVTSPQPSGGYPLGTEITVEAIAGKGYRFESWEGDISGSENLTSILMDSPKTLTAHFVKEAQFPWWGVVAGIAGVIVLVAAGWFAYVRVRSRAD